MGECSPGTSGEVNMYALMAAIMGVKRDLSGRIERTEGRILFMEGSF